MTAHGHKAKTVLACCDVNSSPKRLFTSTPDFKTSLHPQAESNEPLPWDIDPQQLYKSLGNPPKQPAEGTLKA